MKGLILLFLGALQLYASEPVKRESFDFETVGKMAIQDRGRLKPLDTFARESVLYITGKRQWKNLSPIETLFGLLIAYDQEWEDEPFIRIDSGPLKLELGFPTDRKYFSAKELQASEKLRALAKEVFQKEQKREKLTDLEKKVAQLQNQRGLLQVIMTGEAWAILPNPEGEGKPWFSLASLGGQGEPLPYSPDTNAKLTSTMREFLGAFLKKDAQAFNNSGLKLAEMTRFELAPGKYPTPESLSREITYNSLRPFHWAWILYLTAFSILLIYNVSGNKIANYVGFTALFGGFGLHIFGFILRCMISGRPPVTNMYESVIWVTWGCMLFSLIIWRAYKNAIIPNAACVFSIVGLMLADNLPLVLDPSIQPLEPVLRSNFWLTIHVLTITLSYAAFALSLCLGNVVLGHYVFKPGNTKLIQNFSLYMYRAMQIGVVLLAAGTILGGVWADYSWGRFWGWDPKEVWALIALLLYLAVLHGRFTGWLKGFGFVATTVVSFLGVLMAWYGVNFVLGVGLHSYGFGTGGMSYVLSYVAAQIGFIGFAYSRYSSAKRSGGVGEAAIFPR